LEDQCWESHNNKKLNLASGGGGASRPGSAREQVGARRARTRLHDFTFPTLSWGTHRLLRCRIRRRHHRRRRSPKAPPARPSRGGRGTSAPAAPPPPRLLLQDRRTWARRRSPRTSSPSAARVGSRSGRATCSASSM
jgi:hypothetical protein